MFPKSPALEKKIDVRGMVLFVIYYIIIPPNNRDHSNSVTIFF